MKKNVSGKMQKNVRYTELLLFFFENLEPVAFKCVILAVERLNSQHAGILG